MSTHIVNLSDNGAGRSDECVRALKNQKLPAASDGLLRHNLVILQRAKDTSVIHRIKYILLLNATAVSDFKKTLRKKQTMQ